MTLARDRLVVGLWQNVGPWRMRGLDSRTRSVLQLAAGQIARTQLSIGDQLELTARPTAHLELATKILPAPLASNACRLVW